MAAVYSGTDAALKSLTYQHILSVEQFTPDVLEALFALAQSMDRQVAFGRIDQLLASKVVANVFYEASTRTDLSFQSATQRLGGRVISTAGGVHYSSVTKGESLHDTIKTIACYSDAIVLRHPTRGSAREAAAASDALRLAMHSPTPIINAGDGTGEHPTQALLDLYTIKDRFGENIDGLTIGFLGDLRNGRTVHSLIKLLAIDHCHVKVVCVAPESLTMPSEYVEFARSRQMPVEETDDLQAAIGQMDVLYVTRVQRERFVAQQLDDLSASVYGMPYDSLDSPRKDALRPLAELNAAQEYLSARDAYVVDPMMLSQARKEMILLHPLPRVNEIPEEVDTDDRAYYFRQVQNCLYIRMALLAAVLDCLPL
ncbi:MAG TPA: aspartate carbamoyltransferase [Chloroflexia bacterium]|nr:aspartate carbamoyltransferase [Chloroflexia bacterium]